MRRAAVALVLVLGRRDERQLGDLAGLQQPPRLPLGEAEPAWIYTLNFVVQVRELVLLALGGEEPGQPEP